MPHRNYLLATSIALVSAAPLYAAPVNRSVVVSSLHYGPSAAGGTGGTAFQLTGHIAYQFEPGASGDASGVVAIFINGVPLTWEGTGGTGVGGICGGTQPVRVGPATFVGESGGTLLYTCFAWCSNCVLPTGLCVPPGAAVTPISICICQPACAVAPPPLTATAPPGSVNTAVAFSAEVPPLPPGTLITVSIAAAPGAIPEVDFTDDSFTATIANLQRCGRADLGSQGGLTGADGLLDNNDFVAFIDAFFNGDTAADLGSQGGVPVPDGQFDNNDFVAFIDAFFAGCG